MPYLATNVFDADGVKTFWDFSFAGVSPDADSGTTPYLYPEDVKALELYRDAEGNAQAAVRLVQINPSQPTRAVIVGSPIAAGRQVKIYRETEIRFPLVDYRDRQSVSEFDLDLANRQAIFVAQETQDVASNSATLDKNDNYDVLNRRIVNLAPGIDPTDAVNLNQLEHAIRVPASEPTVAVLPAAASRANRLLSFDADGQPVVTFPQAGDATDLEMRLASVTGSTLIGDGDSTVSAKLAAATASIADLGLSITEIMDLFESLAGPTGAEMVGFRFSTLYSAMYQLGVSPFHHGAVGDFDTDDTAAVQAAADEAAAQRRPLLINGDFGVTHVDINGTGGLTIVAAGTLTGLSTTAQESVLTIRNLTDLKLQGRLIINGKWNTLYATGLSIYTDNTAGVTKMDIASISYVGCRVGVRVGRHSEPNALLSEISMFGGHFYGCPTCYELIGTQTVLTFIGCNIISGKEGAPAPVAAEWAELPRTAVRTFGANYQMIGGEALITDVTTGLLFDNRPIASSTVGNRYGTIDINATIESASPVCKFWNPEGIGSLVAGVGGVTLRDCPGFHSQNTVPLIECADDFPGRVVATNNTMSYPGVRTVVNIAVGNAPCDIVADDNSFGQGFMKGFGSITGGRLSFGYQILMRVTHLNQSIPAGPGSAPLAFTTKPVNAHNNRFAGPFNTANGAYIVPAGGLKSVRVGVNLDQLAPRPNSAVVLQVNDVPSYYVGANGERYITASWDLGDLPVNTKLQLVYVSGSGTSGFNFTPNINDQITMSGRY